MTLPNRKVLVSSLLFVAIAATTAGFQMAGWAYFVPVLLIAIALGFDFLNGSHDVSTAVATVIHAGTMKPKSAIGLASVLNFLGALTVGTSVAMLITSVVPINLVTAVLIASVLIAGSFWNWLTLNGGIPASSTHCLLGSLIGAGAAAAGWNLHLLNFGALQTALVGLAVSPLVGWLATGLICYAVAGAKAIAVPMPGGKSFNISQGVVRVAIGTVLATGAAAAAVHWNVFNKMLPGLVVAPEVVWGVLAAGVVIAVAWLASSSWRSRNLKVTKAIVSTASAFTLAAVIGVGLTLSFFAFPKVAKMFATVATTALSASDAPMATTIGWFCVWTLHLVALVWVTVSASRAKRQAEAEGTKFNRHTYLATSLLIVGAAVLPFAPVAIASVFPTEVAFGWYCVVAAYGLAALWLGTEIAGATDPSGRAAKGLQILGMGSVAFTHGANDSQKTMGIIVMVLAKLFHDSGYTTAAVPLWVMGSASLAMGLGSFIGGGKVIEKYKHISAKPIDNVLAAVSQLVTAVTIFVASLVGAPVSTTHIIGSAVLGGGQGIHGFFSVNSKTIKDIGLAWLLTIPVCAIMSATIYLLLSGDNTTTIVVVFLAGVLLGPLAFTGIFGLRVRLAKSSWERAKRKAEATSSKRWANIADDRAERYEELTESLSHWRGLPMPWRKRGGATAPSH